MFLHQGIYPLAMLLLQAFQQHRAHRGLQQRTQTAQHRAEQDQQEGQEQEEVGGGSDFRARGRDFRVGQFRGSLQDREEDSWIQGRQPPESGTCIGYPADGGKLGDKPESVLQLS